MQPFLVRLPDGLHGRLKHGAAEAGVSMNEYCVKKLAAAAMEEDSFSRAIVGDARALVGDGFIGAILFGSFARGAATQHSDIDVMLVVDRSVAITRELYRAWDAAPRTPQDRPLDAHFVHLPSRRVAGGVWAEAAVDGIVLADRERRIHAALADVRRDLADGILRRHTVHGQAYWTTAA